MFTGVNMKFGLILLLFLIKISRCSIYNKNTNIQDFCSIKFSHNIYIGPGEKHQLNLRSEIDDTKYKRYQKLKRKCIKAFKTTDPGSDFSVTISNMNIPSCSQHCRCNYFEISEPGYKKKYCHRSNTELYFTSKSDSFSVEFLPNYFKVFEVTFTFTVERNFYVITGIPQKENQLSGHIIESPYFPLRLPSNYISEYILQSSSPRGYVVLIFLDFLISSESYVEISGHNSSNPVRFYGNIFRPPIFVSQGNYLSFKFDANTRLPGRGFRALAYFVKNYDSFISTPFIDCGGSKNGYGGVITISFPKKDQLYDCVWLIQPHLLPRINSYILSAGVVIKNVGLQASLEFREDIFSNSKLVKNINCDNLNCSTFATEITAPAINGFYVHFHGYLCTHSMISITYSIYHIGNCTDKEFECEDGRCLNPDLHCDGIVHCTDSTDELNCITPEESTLIIPQKPKKLVVENHSIFLIILFIGICVLLIIFLVIFAIAWHYKLCSKVNTAIPQTRNEMRNSLVIPPVENSINITLPSYEEFIKLSDCYPPLLYIRKSNVNKTNTNLLGSTNIASQVLCRSNHNSLLSLTNHSRSQSYTSLSCNQNRSDKFCIEYIRKSHSDWELFFRKSLRMKISQSKDAKEINIVKIKSSLASYTSNALLKK